jgi:AAA+ superfamily predicted ATPase
MESKHSAIVYADHLQHLADELRKLDLMLLRRCCEFRAALKPGSYSPAHQNVYISDEEIDSLFHEHDIDSAPHEELEMLDREFQRLDRHIAETVESSLNQGVDLPLWRLRRIFGLSDLEAQAVVVCLAPELRRKYDRIYAYLQDDITRKRPSVALILELLCRTDEDRWQLQELFAENGTLLRTRLLRMVDDLHSPSGSSNLARLLKLDTRILSYLTGSSRLAPELEGVSTLQSSATVGERLAVEPAITKQVASLIDWRMNQQSQPVRNLVVHLHGPKGVGKRALALHQAKRMGFNLLCLDLSMLRGSMEDIRERLLLSFREAMLLQAPLFVGSVDKAVRDAENGPTLVKMLARLVEEYGWLTFLAGEEPWPSSLPFGDSRFESVKIPRPGFGLRRRAWRQSLELHGGPADEILITDLANRFRLTPGEIHRAVDALSFETAVGSDEPVDIGQSLAGSCRSLSNQRLRELAIKIDARYSWSELVLPESKRALLRLICDQVRQQHKVFGEWGFGEKLRYGKGLSALFTGPPGTGKTMAVQVLASEINLDLYKVDLSTVISKYIGETEKNLSQIFKEAETSNAILFFDEADALFGKRTEVSDAHDRYANIEVSYLLQRMEEYNGIVILASNFRVNMDDAFVRRIRFIIDFPFPDEASRLEIWKVHFPKRAPRSDDIDYPLLAKKFAIPGGNIKNVVLNAAFMAAKEDGPIRMEHLLEGTKHEYEKIGKLWSADSSVDSPAKSSTR